VLTCTPDKFYEQSLNFTTSTSIVSIYKDIEGDFYCRSTETLLSRVLGTVMEKFDSCMEKIVDKFEARLEKLYGDLSMANCRIYRLEQELRVRDQAVSSWHDRGNHLRNRATCRTVRLVNGHVGQATTCHH